MAEVSDVRPLLASILTQFQKYIAALDLSQACIKSLNNLSEQLEASQCVSTSHPILQQQPDVMEKLTRSIHTTVTEQVSELQAMM